MYRKEIVYDRETRDYAMYLDSELVGFAKTYHDGEVALDQLVFELISGEAFRTAVPVEAAPDVADDRAHRTTDSADDPFNDGPSQEEQAASAKTVRLFRPRLFSYADLGSQAAAHTCGDDCACLACRAEYDNAPAGQCFPDEPLGECALDGRPAWSLDETLVAPLCPDHKEQEREWIANRELERDRDAVEEQRLRDADADEPRIGSTYLTGVYVAPELTAAGGAYTSAERDAAAAELAREPMAMAGSVWAPGPPPPPPAPPTTAPAPTPASALLPLIKLLLEAWAEEERPTPYDRELAALARAFEPPPSGPSAVERERQVRLGLSIHATYVGRRQVLGGILRDGDAQQRTSMAEALALYLSDATGVQLPVSMVVQHFERMAA